MISRSTTRSLQIGWWSAILTLVVSLNRMDEAIILTMADALIIMRRARAKPLASLKKGGSPGSKHLRIMSMRNLMTRLRHALGCGVLSEHLCRMRQSDM